MPTKVSDNFAVEDIRRLRDDYHNRYTDKDGNFDWDRATVETEKKAAAVRAEIARIRAEKMVKAE